MAEYGVILLIIAAALVGTLTVLQGSVSGLLSAAASAF
jgi:Flp pilus assembly pilin Flp